MYARLCVPFPNYKKITGLDLIRIEGDCVYGCYNKLLTHYSYQVYSNFKDFNFNFDDIIWKEFYMDSAYFSGNT